MQLNEALNKTSVPVNVLEMDMRVADPISFKKLVDLLRDANLQSISIFSPDRKNNSAAENIAARHKAIQELTTHRSNYYQVSGVGYEIEPKGDMVLVHETSFIALDAKLSFMLELNRSFGADFFIHAGPETGGYIQMFSTASGQPITTWKKAVEGIGADGYTVLKDGTPFHFV